MNDDESDIVKAAAAFHFIWRVSRPAHDCTHVVPLCFGALWPYYVFGPPPKLSLHAAQKIASVTHKANNMRLEHQASEEEVQPFVINQQGPDVDEDDSLRFCIRDDDDDEGANENGDEDRVGLLQDNTSGDVTRPKPRGGPVEQWESDLQSERRAVGGAAVAGAIGGLILMGPLAAIVVAGGAAAVATTRGKAGEVTRATGEVMAQAGDRLQNLDKKHRITEKAAGAFSKVVDKLKTRKEREDETRIGLTS